MGKMRPSEFVRLLIPEDDPIRIEFEAAVTRIRGGPGLYPHPSCPDCRIERVTGWESPTQYFAHERMVPCESHRI